MLHNRRQVDAIRKTGSMGGSRAACSLGAFAPAAQAQDFFSALFGGFGRSRRALSRCRSAVRAARFSAAWRAAARYGGGGRPFACAPATAAISRFPAGQQSRAATCNSFCPASETKVVYGSTSTMPTADNGKPYSELPNAFRYRNELVSGCTCNGKDQVGLAPVNIENDPTLRKGDIVAGENGLLVAGRSADSAAPS